MPALLILITLLGLAVGSFLNVVVHRVPKGLSLIAPASSCPHCGHPIRARHNVPVLGWLLLRGRCADCGAPIGPRYPLVEAGTGALFLVLALWFSHLHLLSALPAYLWFAAAGLALALIDLDVRRLPNAIVLPSYPVLAALLALSAAVQHDWWSLARAAAGAAALFAFYLLLGLIHPRGMQFGDVKLAGLLGLVLGYLSWPTLILGAFGGFLLGALAGVALLAAGRGSGKTAVPFGPFMITAALLAVFLSPSLDRLSEWWTS
ncbi:MAG TPA: prepilin peptidase [Actinophytocola sp.]|uniref:prepilin peptidase n=1 Tax=Actinophytocola sp. TaxID=1872138 RepID=UPI002DF89856|nr:prepilin peptidase [Actinophytocola sp.]